MPENTKPTPAERIAAEAQAYAQSIVETVREPLVVLDADLRVVSANRSFYQTFQVSGAETENHLLYELGSGQWDLPALRQVLEDILPKNSHFHDLEVSQDFPGIGPKTMLLNARKLYRPGNHVLLILLAIEDITERKEAQAQLQAAHDRLQSALERERRITEALQRPLALEVTEDAFPGLSVATLYEAALEEANVGGDFFDAFALPKGRVALAIADASGKGLSAAVRAMQVKDVLRAFTREYPHSPAHIVARLNDFVCDTRRFDDRGGEMFSCLILAVLDPATGEGAVVSAGCEPPLVLRASGAVEILEAAGLPLGIEREEVYAATPLLLAPGDTLLMVTDGITEARRNAELLGYEGMVALAKESAAPPTLREMGKAILDGARAFGGGSLRDDACVVLARRPWR